MRKLLEPILVGKLEIKNRMAMAPMGTGLARRDGVVSDRQIDYYARRALGGVGLLIVELSTVDPRGVGFPGELGIHYDKHIERLSVLAEKIKENGAKAGIQLVHPGRQTSFRTKWIQPVAPSPIPCPLIEVMPRQLELDEIYDIIEKFGLGAVRAVEAGFDLIEFHGAHGYLISQFLSPLSNRRADEFGGSLENRARFALEIVKRTRQKIGSEIPLSFRISADEYLEGGQGIEETRLIAKMLQDAGIDLMNVSAGTYGSIEWSVPPILLPRGCHALLSAEVKKSLHIPVMTAGRISNFSVAESIIREGKADMVAMGRPLWADPDFAKKIAEGREREINVCIACNSCLDTLWRGKGVKCIVNPDLGNEGPYIYKKVEKPKKVLILGACPAALEVARVANLRGHKVALWEEKNKIGGPWAWLKKSFIKQRFGSLAADGVEIEMGKKASLERVKEFRPDIILVTSKLVPIVPAFEWVKQDSVFTVDEVFEGAMVANSAAIIGASSAGLEAAQMLSRKGVRVIVFESSDKIGAGIEPTAKKVLVQKLAKEGVKFIQNAAIIGYSGKRLSYRTPGPAEQSTEVNCAILALGYEQNTELAGLLRLKGYSVISIDCPTESRYAVDSILDGEAIGLDI